MFASLQLNRDIWKDELVAEIVENNFVFWQIDVKSDMGKQFVE